MMSFKPHNCFSQTLRAEKAKHDSKGRSVEAGRERIQVEAVIKKNEVEWQAEVLNRETIN